MKEFRELSAKTYAFLLDDNKEKKPRAQRNV